jgi:hypothetical protein
MVRRALLSNMGTLIEAEKGRRRCLGFTAWIRSGGAARCTAVGAWAGGAEAQETLAMAD